MGEATGKWASTSWAFYSGIAYNEGFTIVAKNLLPKNVQDYNDALKAAKALASSYGMAAPVFWTYPHNNKGADDSDLHNFSILADFTSSVALADYLFNAFHNVNHTALAGSASESLLSKRAGYCLDYNEKERVQSNKFLGTLSMMRVVLDSCLTFNGIIIKKNYIK
ncbi:hypothetical protein BDW59DRAFT_160061 [Aspergillus cavernicola]|uniref:Uncharacterized protein n=1 Tax=Aspergillus cavernicola TaxID=176166 RepID=A0ABR4IIZ9_9EURO